MLAAYSDQSLKRAGTVSERLFLYPHAMQHGQIKIAQRGFLFGTNTASGTQRAFAPAGQGDGKVLLKVKVPALDPAAEHHHGIIEQTLPTFIQALQLVQEIGDLLYVPSDAASVLLLA